MFKICHYFSFLFFLFFGPSFLIGASTEIQLTTLYPAPFGDFENVMTNSLEVLGTVRAGLTSGAVDIDVSAHQVADLNRIRHYRGLQVLGEFVAPYSTVDRSLIPLADFSDYDWDRIFFHRSGKGVFFNNPQSALFFFQTSPVGIAGGAGFAGTAMPPASSLSGVEDHMGLRAKNNIILHPGAPLSSSFETYRITFNKNRAVLCNGELVVRGDFSVEKADGTSLFKITSSGIVMNGDLTIHGEVSVDGDVSVANELSVGSFSATTASFKNLRVTNAFLVQNSAETTKEVADEASNFWDHCQSHTYTESRVVMGKVRIKDVLLMESGKENKRRKVRRARGDSAWTWGELPRNDRSKLQIVGQLISKCIYTPFRDRFEIRTAINDGSFARFRDGQRGSRNPVLSVPGMIHSRRLRGSKYV